jgi:phage replication-related protein YjqB (UPF0714/DUF867 family)
VDKYRSFAELNARERLGEDCTIDVVEQDPPVAIIAPRGSKIEPGTSEIVLFATVALVRQADSKACRRPQ